MNQYTKGEWTINTVKGIRVQTDNKCICLVGENDEEDKINAHLIAAAVNGCASVNPDNPYAVAESIRDMYEALKELSKYIQFNKGNAAPIYDKAIKVLAKIVYHV